MLLTSTLVPLLPLCRLEQLNSVLASFQGTHSYHNFTNEVCSAPWHPLVEKSSFTTIHQLLASFVQQT